MASFSFPFVVDRQRYHAFFFVPPDLFTPHAQPCAVILGGHVAVTADGASWMWGVTADLFPLSTPIVDWYHAAQHLDQAAIARYETDSPEAKRWSEVLKS